MSLSKVLVIAHDDDKGRAEDILKKIKTKATQFQLYECDPGKRKVEDLEEKLQNLQLGETCDVPTSKKILFIVTKNSHNDNWLTYVCDVAAQMAWTVPLVVDDISRECLDIRIRGQCIRLAEDGSIRKVIGALESTAHKDFCLPMAHIAPGLCSNYFFGFINVVFGTGEGPDFQGALDNWQEKNCGSQDTLVRRMILLIPKSCQCKRIGTKVGDYPSPSSHSIEDFEQKIVFRQNELQPDRTYNQYMYKVQREGAGGGDAAAAPAYNVVVVMVSTVNTLFNMCQIDYAGITEDVMFKERELFSELLRQRLEVYKDQVELIDEFDDKDPDCDLPKLIYERCKEIVRKGENAGNAEENMDTN